MLRRVTERLPTELQAGVELSLIGECVSLCQKQDIENHKDDVIVTDLVPSSVCEDGRPSDSCACLQEEAGCSKAGNERPFKSGRSRNCRADGNLSRLRNGLQICEELISNNLDKSSLEMDIWMELSMRPVRLSRNLPNWIPQVHTLRVQGCSCIPDFHLILYEQPKLGSHHFSIRPWSFITFENQVQEDWKEREHHQKANWLLDLEMHQEAPDIDLVVLQLNCAGAAEQSVRRLVASLDTPCKRLSRNCILSLLCRHLVAASVALVATLYYSLVQAGSGLLKLWPFVHLSALFAKFMKLTHRNIRIRCYELTGWPIILLWKGCGRDQPNIAAAHRTALIRHSTWLAIMFDIIFGLVGGVFFLSCQSAISYHLRSMVRSLTDDILRTGCIWLMGVPAGFKLNTELAGMVGLFSLNVIQVWSTLMYLLKPLFGPFLYTLAIAGMLLGITVPAAMIADLLFLATLHISTLHQLVAFMYSNQLQALAALWRLFRGRKRNTLRGRIDSYDCNVEQHVVGSLMFTPLLLLLPTTSVFYIFFTMLFTSLSVVRFSLQIFIAVVHCFPYAQVAIWLLKPRRFPSGVWLEALREGRSAQQGALQLSKGQGKQRRRKKKSPVSVCAQTFITFLGIKTASIGEILFPYIRQLGGGLTWSSCALCIYKIFSGERWSVSMELGAPVLPPWTTFSMIRFWWLCYDAVLASM